MNRYIDYVIERIPQIIKWILPRRRGKPLEFAIYGKGYMSYMVYLYYRRVGFFDEVFKAIYQLTLSPNAKVNSNYKVMEIYALRHIRPYDYEKLLLALTNPTSKFYGYDSTIDYKTNENKFVAYFLDKLLFDLEDLKRRLKGKVKDGEIEGINHYLNKFYYIRKSTFLSIFQHFPRFEFSERIIYDPIYNRVFKYFLNYSGNLVDINPTRIDEAIIEEWRIFELYVLLKTVDFIKRRYGNFEIKVREIREEMSADEIFNDWRFNFNDKLRIYYQRPIDNEVKETDIFSVSVRLRPDIIVEKNGKLYILDAKHKAEPQKEDYTQLHTYRDAIRRKIRLKSGRPRYKNVVRYAVLICDDDLALTPNEEVLTRWKTIRRAGVGYIFAKRLENLLKKWGL